MSYSPPLWCILFALCFHGLVICMRFICMLLCMLHFFACGCVCVSILEHFFSLDFKYSHPCTFFSKRFCFVFLIDWYVRVRWLPLQQIQAHERIVCIVHVSSLESLFSSERKKSRTICIHSADCRPLKPNWYFFSKILWLLWIDPCKRFSRKCVCLQLSLSAQTWS